MYTPTKNLAGGQTEGIEVPEDINGILTPNVNDPTQGLTPVVGQNFNINTSPSSNRWDAITLAINNHGITALIFLFTVILFWEWLGSGAGIETFALLILFIIIILILIPLYNFFNSIIENRIKSQKDRKI